MLMRIVVSSTNESVYIVQMNKTGTKGLAFNCIDMFIYTVL